VRKLNPDLTGKRGFRTCAEYEDAHGRWVRSEAFNVRSCAGSGWMEGVAQSCAVVSGLLMHTVESHSPVKLFRPSAVSRPPLLILYGLSSCNTLPMVTG